jgi:DNA-binding transcriptional MerR regulator
MFGLSRTTLLYYDELGLLRPGARSAKGYRLYSAADAERLRQICHYRKAGLPLGSIQRILDAPDRTLAQALRRRLAELRREMDRLRDQQRFILGLLESSDVAAHEGPMTKRRWVQLLRAAGFSEADMDRWHADFERLSPEEHLEFLEFLGIPQPEIERIRERARLHP